MLQMLMPRDAQPDNCKLWLPFAVGYAGEDIQRLADQLLGVLYPASLAIAVCVPCRMLQHGRYLMDISVQSLACAHRLHSHRSPVKSIPVACV